MPAGFNAFAGRLHANQAHVLVTDELVEGADGVAAAAHAGDHGVGQAPFGIEDLLPSLASDDGLEVADEHGIRVRADHAANKVVGGFHVGDPVANGLVDSVLEGTGARFHRDDLGAEEAHTIDVEGLAHRVLGAHVDDALEAEHGADGGGGYPVLAGAGLSDDALLAHALGQQALAEGVVDLVGAGVGQILSLEVDASAAAVPAQVFRVVQRGGAGRRNLSSGG